MTKPDKPDLVTEHSACIPEFTPGPWTPLGKIQGADNRHEIRINRKGDYRHESVVVKGINAEANAHLIASAPALYAALEDTANDCCDIRIALQSPVMTDSEKLAMIQKLVDKSRDARQSALALARGEKGGEVK